MGDLRDTTAPEFFGGMHDAYDDLIRRCVPRYDEMIERLIAYLPATADRVLELGCGTGNVSVALAHRFPGARLSIVDASPEMVAHAGARLDEMGAGAGMVDGHAAYFEDLALADGKFDVVVSSIALHHVKQKGPLYSKVARWLRPGGEFWFADQLAGSTDRTNAHNWSMWLEFCRAPSHCTEVEVRDLLAHAEAHDHYTPLPEHFRLLTRAGFDPDSLDCVWRNLIWGIIGARTPVES